MIFTQLINIIRKLTSRMTSTINTWRITTSMKSSIVTIILTCALFLGQVIPILLMLSLFSGITSFTPIFILLIFFIISKRKGLFESSNKIMSSNKLSYTIYFSILVLFLTVFACVLSHALVALFVLYSLILVLFHVKGDVFNKILEYLKVVLYYCYTALSSCFFVVPRISSRGYLVTVCYNLYTLFRREFFMLCILNPLPRAITLWLLSLLINIGFNSTMAYCIEPESAVNAGTVNNTGSDSGTTSNATSTTEHGETGTSPGVLDHYIRKVYDGVIWTLQLPLRLVDFWIKDAYKLLPQEATNVQLSPTLTSTSTVVPETSQVVIASKPVAMQTIVPQPFTTSEDFLGNWAGNKKVSLDDINKVIVPWVETYVKSHTAEEVDMFISSIHTRNDLDVSSGNLLKIQKFAGYTVKFLREDNSITDPNLITEMVAIPFGKEQHITEQEFMLLIQYKQHLTSFANSGLNNNNNGEIAQVKHGVDALAPFIKKMVDKYPVDTVRQFSGSIMHEFIDFPGLTRQQASYLNTAYSIMVDKIYEAKKPISNETLISEAKSALYCVYNKEKLYIDKEYSRNTYETYNPKDSYERKQMIAVNFIEKYAFGSELSPIWSTSNTEYPKYQKVFEYIAPFQARCANSTDSQERDFYAHLYAAIAVHDLTRVTGLGYNTLLSKAYDNHYDYCMGTKMPTTNIKDDT
jgi:hypothetical protein